ncbi:MAG: magnesium chelatase ATPase subunit I [Acidobacteria bacterium]|nr:magnesium chelatase ATPase subunit I [Acidobacteriota bacterium]
MTPRRAGNSSKSQFAPARLVYPFTALVGQEEMKLALLLNVIAPTIGGVLIMGHRGTGKSTAVRALADLLPPLRVVRDCAFNCDPQDQLNLCDDCRTRSESAGKFAQQKRRVPVVDLPLGATEDRVCGTIDIERALREGVKSFEPGLLARSNRGFLYIDEVNLLEDHLADILLDVAVTGRNAVEREGISIEHPARFVLVGSGNPEEGELRPQLLDRFGLYTEVQTSLDLDERVGIVERREAFERDPVQFVKARETEQAKLRRRLQRAQRLFVNVETSRTLLRLIAELCIRLKVDGHRGEITIARAARALAAYEGRRQATAEDVRRVAAMSLRHRLRRDPLEQTTSGASLDEAIAELFGDAGAGDEQNEVSPRKNEDDPGTASSGGNGQGGAHRPNGSDGETLRGDESNQSRQRRKEERAVPPIEARLPDDALISKTQVRSARGKSVIARQHDRARHYVDGRRGRYSRATAAQGKTRTVAVDATLRAAASSHARPRPGAASDTTLRTGVRISTEDLRFKRFRRRAGTLFILAVDASGSMAVNRINQAKGALAHLLRHSYLNRDRVALVSFRKRSAELLLPPSNSPARAKTILDALPVGGPTPLAAGLARSLEVAKRLKAGDARQVVLVIFTDGRANVALSERVASETNALKARVRAEIVHLGAALRQAQVASVVVDTQNRYTSGGEGQFLAEALGGRYVHLSPGGTAHSISEAFEET